MDNDKSAVPLPLYQCHKKVRAAKISGITLLQSGSSLVRLTLDEIGGYVDVTSAYVAKHEPKVGGYFVAYDDGYVSYSPAKAFEEGYARVPE